MGARKGWSFWGHGCGATGFACLLKQNSSRFEWMFILALLINDKAVA